MVWRMDKRLIIVFLFLIGASSCAKSWNEAEKSAFINDCIAMNGKEIACVCLLACLEKEYITYNAALNNIEKKDLSKECRVCLEQCEQSIY